MQSTMQNSPLTVTEILRYAVDVHGDRTVSTATGDGFRHATYREVGKQAARLAHALRRLGIDGDQRVATFMWNNQEHFEAYVPRVDWATALFSTLERSRNVITHSGFLAMPDAERIGMHIRDWNKQVSL